MSISIGRLRIDRTSRLKSSSFRRSPFAVVGAVSVRGHQENESNHRTANSFKICERLTFPSFDRVIASGKLSSALESIQNGDARSAVRSWTRILGLLQLS